MPPSIIILLPPPPPGTPLPSQAISTIQSNIRTHFHPIPQDKWSLEHRLFRETPYHNPSGGPPRNSDEHGFSSVMQILTVSWKPRTAFVGVTKVKVDAVGSDGVGNALANGDAAAAAAAAAMVKSESQSGEREADAITNGEVRGVGDDTAVKGPFTTLSGIPLSSLDEYTILLTQRLAPLWMSRGGTLAVRDGICVKVQSLIFRMGEIKQLPPASGPGSTAPPITRGVICEIALTEESVGDDAARAVFTDVWETVGDGVVGARIFDGSIGVSDGFDQGIGRWMEALRGRS